MKYRPVVLLFVSGILLAWAQSWFRWPSRMLGVQLDLLPAWVLFYALYRSWKELFAACILGGFLYDSISLNYLGITPLSLLLLSYTVHKYRRMLLFNSVWAQMLLGLGLGVLVPLLSLLQLTGVPVSPLIDPTLLWVFMVLGVTNAAAAPLIIRLMQYFSEGSRKSKRRFFYHVAPSMEINTGKEQV